MSATKALNGITPHEKLFGQKPVVRDLHMCGSVVFHFIPKKKRKTKLDMRSDPGIFLGYAKRSLGYRILDVCTGNLVERRDVVFHEDMAADPKYVRDLINNRYFSTENELPAHIDFVSSPVSRVHLPLDEFKDWDKDDDSLSSNMDNDDDDEYYDTDGGMTEAFVDDEVEEDGSSSSGDSSDDDSDSDFSGSNVEAMEDDATAHASGSDNEIDDNPTPSRGEHTTDARTSGSAGTSGSASASRSTSTNRSAAHSPADLDTAARPLRRSNRVRRPNSRYDSRTFVLAQTLIQCMMIATVCDLLDPTSVQEAFASEHAVQWKRAMDVEYDPLMQNQTWVLVPRPKPTRDKPINILMSLWVLALKRNERGEIERHKARLAIKGYRQKYGWTIWKHTRQSCVLSQCY
ncbi:hypothetical protein PR001_g14334 [Phytophthora rubi]|uniref:Retroviral polymerase SH3-like domain-containing protein n=1 Tax=Phytophthora rubi TaxID=129364 RepID=A0A6A3LP86_9STRA|nr:hypothetical protein PR001_g14334 [Phytophthora rubi]